MKKLLVLSLTMFLCLSISAQNWWKDGIRGEGPTVTKTLNISPFHAVSLGFSGNVYLKQGSTQSVEVEGQQNIINNIKTGVRDGLWKINFDRPVRKHEPVNIYITIPKVTKAHLSGSGDLVSKGSFTGLDELALSISGSGDIRFEAEASAISARISGSGDIDLSGKAAKVQLKVSGSGDIEAYDLQARDCNIQISGSGNCQITAEEMLEVKVSGSGDVYYKGRPRIHSKISGSGDLISRS